MQAELAPWLAASCRAPAHRQEVLGARQVTHNSSLSSFPIGQVVGRLDSYLSSCRLLATTATRLEECRGEVAREAPSAPTLPSLLPTPISHSTSSDSSSSFSSRNLTSAAP